MIEDEDVSRVLAEADIQNSDGIVNTEAHKMDDSDASSSKLSGRSSRRRVHGVILNSNKMKQISDHAQDSLPEGMDGGAVKPDTSAAHRIIEEECSAQSEAVDQSMIAKIKAKIVGKSSPDSSPPQLAYSHNAALVTPLVAATRIASWYRWRRRKRDFQFTQYGKWSYEMSEKVLALVMGHKIRRIFGRNSEVQRMVTTQRDVAALLQDLAQQNLSELEFKSIDFRMRTLQEISSGQGYFATSDKALASSLIRELMNERDKLGKFLFQSSKWTSFPFPGRWIITVKSPKPSHRRSISTPSREGPKSRAIQETPPHVKHAVNKPLQKVSAKVHVRHGFHEFEETEEDASQSNSNVYRPKPLNLDQKDGEGGLRKSRQRKSVLSSQSTIDRPRSAASKSVPPVKSSIISVTKCRRGDCGHVQLEIISGEKLIPAKKVFFLIFIFFIAFFLFYVCSVLSLGRKYQRYSSR